MNIKTISKQNAPHYLWGENCDGWEFVENENLSIKQECMPAHTAEQLHYHVRTQQFFFILKGTATFEVEGETVEVGENKGVYIEAGKKHRIMNKSDSDVEIILLSQPTTKGDRVNV